MIGGISPIPSAYTTDVVMNDLCGMTELRYSYEHHGSLYASGLRFHKVRAYQFRAESHCTVWHIDAYDTLVEVEQSDWVAELVAALPSGHENLWTIRHFLIYLDDAGAYEFAADDYEWLGHHKIEP